MTAPPALELAPLFTAVEQALSQNRDALNQADLYNANHGDHMIAIFNLAAQAARDNQDARLPDAMQVAADRLRDQADNGSAQVYGRGLAQLAGQFRKYNLDLEDFVGYVRHVLSDAKDESGQDGATPSRDVLKALMGALAGWQQVEAGKQPTENPLDMGFLFDLGVAYMQAKQRAGGSAGGGNRAQMLADAAASVSPLSSVPHRYQSGKLAIQALLEAMQQA
jgi:hypothetical protein